MTFEALKKVELFRALSREGLAELSGLFREQRFPADGEVFQQGDPPHAFYVVAEGAVALYRETPGRAVQLLARLGPGEFFGEVGLFDGRPRADSARAGEPLRVLVAERTALIPFLSRYPLLELRFRAAAIQRHSANVAASLNVGTRSEARIRVGRDVVITDDDGARFTARLENPSAGGACIAAAPDSWRPGGPVRFQLGTPGHPGLLALSGKVSWRKGTRVGIAFLQAAGQDMRISRALRYFLAEDEGDGEPSRRRR